MTTAEKYLRPEVIRQVSRLDLRAKFIVEGFLSGLHSSPYHGFSVEFSEHRKYVPGDDPKDIDWNVYAKTDKYYVKKFEAETNLTSYLAVDTSVSMAYSVEDARHQLRDHLPALRQYLRHRAAEEESKENLTKFEYAVCLAAALGYLMIHQQDPVGLVVFDKQIRTSLPPKSKRSQLGSILAVLANLKPSHEETDVAACLHQLASMIRTKSLVILFSDLLVEPEPVISGLHHLRHRGNEVIVFHILDVTEHYFPFEGVIEFEDPESHQMLVVDAREMREYYLENLAADQDKIKQACARADIDYVTIDTSVSFDRALMKYLLNRQKRF
ncbi:MAG: DUF58 domain-containing protein [Gemmatales bacterium]|nr:DUF58 domain-containing protein [Gemmatales bacterium]MDW8385475.1 DUF58 domain-containing protein [Gemmatales bacterium]